MTPFPRIQLAPPESAASLREALLANREQTLTQLYRRTFPMVRRQVQQRGGTGQDAQDVFQDALVIFYEQAVGNTLVLTASASTYLVSISRNLWGRELHRRRQQPRADLTEACAQLPDEVAAAEPEVLPVLDYVERLGAKCKSILLSFYYFQQPLEQIAAAHQYGSIRSATVQKFKCLERLRKSVRAVLAEALAY